MRLKEFLKEGFSVRSLTADVPENFISKKKLTRPKAKKITKEIKKAIKTWVHTTYYSEIPLKDIFDVLERNGLIPLQEDLRKWDGLLLGGVKKTEQVLFLLGWKGTKDGQGRYEVVPDAGLNLSYYKMPSGKYEVLAYVS